VSIANSDVSLISLFSGTSEYIHSVIGFAVVLRFANGKDGHTSINALTTSATVLLRLGLEDCMSTGD